MEPPHWWVGHSINPVRLLIRGSGLASATVKAGKGIELGEPRVNAGGSVRTLVRVVLIDPSHPGNIGSVARAMKNMALSDLVLVRPRSFPHAESAALAAGADDILADARVVESVEQAIADCAFIAGTTSRPRSYYWEFTTPRDVAGRIVALGQENRAALLFGSERYGLATEDLNLCNVLVRIPANPRILLVESRDVGAVDCVRDLHGA